jgi:hypothetical protein
MAACNRPVPGVPSVTDAKKKPLLLPATAHINNHSSPPPPPRRPGALVSVLFKTVGAAITTIIEDGMAAVSAKGPKHESSQELDELEEQGVVALTVPSKYRGTATDRRDMQTLGKLQVLRVSAGTGCHRWTIRLECLLIIVYVTDPSFTPQRNFRFVAMLGFASTVICTWEILLSYRLPILFH